MSAATSSLWPSDLALNVIRPVTILKAQADKLSEVTRGILIGEVTTVTGEMDFVVHRLDIIAQKLDGYRHRVLTAMHRDQYYPVVIEAECFKPKTSRVDMDQLYSGKRGVSVRPTSWPPTTDWRPAAAGQDEFIKRVGEVLRSPDVRSVIDSLIARSNVKEMESAALGSPVENPV